MTCSIGSRRVRAACRILVHVGVQQHPVDDMEHAVLGEHVRLGDESGGVSRRDKLSARVGAEVEVFAGSGDIRGIDEAWAVDRCSVDDVVPQDIPELSSVAGDLRDLLGRSLVGRDEEGETADPVKNVGDGGIFGSLVSGIPNGNIGTVSDVGEPFQLIVCFERGVDVTWIVEDSINDEDVEIPITSQLQNVGVVGSAVHTTVE